MFARAFEMARQKIESTGPWKVFDAERRKSVGKALREALGEAVASSRGRGETGDAMLAGRSGLSGVEGELVERLAAKHADAICAAGLPLLKLLKMFGLKHLLTLAAALGED